MGLTLLAQYGLTKIFWVESFLTTIYLINRLPTPVSNNDTPFFKLFKNAPDYLLYKTLDVDVILCYAHMLKTNCHIVVSHVCLLVIAPVKRVICALIL